MRSMWLRLVFRFRVSRRLRVLSLRCRRACTEVYVDSRNSLHPSNRVCSDGCVYVNGVAYAVFPLWPLAHFCIPMHALIAINSLLPELERQSCLFRSRYYVETEQIESELEKSREVSVNTLLRPVE